MYECPYPSQLEGNKTRQIRLRGFGLLVWGGRFYMLKFWLKILAKLKAIS